MTAHGTVTEPLGPHMRIASSVIDWKGYPVACVALQARGRDGWHEIKGLSGYAPLGVHETEQAAFDDALVMMLFSWSTRDGGVLQ